MQCGFHRILSTAVVATGMLCTTAFAQQPVIKIAYIDPLSGPFANVGDGGLRQFQFVADQVNAGKLAGKYRFEIVGYDNIQFTKAPNVMRGMGLVLEKNDSARKELTEKGMAPE